MVEEIPTNKPPLEAFLEQYWKDCEAGAVHTPSEYLAQFLGDDAATGREYLALQDAQSMNPRGDEFSSATPVSTSRTWPTALALSTASESS